MSNFAWFSYFLPNILSPIVERLTSLGNNKSTLSFIFFQEVLYRSKISLQYLCEKINSLKTLRSTKLRKYFSLQESCRCTLVHEIFFVRCSYARLNFHRSFTPISDGSLGFMFFSKPVSCISVTFRFLVIFVMYIWVKVFKNGPIKICGWQPLKKLKWYGLLRSIDMVCLTHIPFK